MPALHFLNRCLVKKTKFRCASKEKAITKFHQAILDTSYFKPLEALLCPFTATSVALTVFEILMKNNYDNPQETVQSEVEVPQTEVDIVEYIGGYVLFTIKKQAHRVKDISERESMLQCLNACETKDVASATAGSASSTAGSTQHPMTQVLDRGGLTKPSSNICQMFVNLESIFRSCFNEAHTLSSEMYFSKCLTSDCVSVCLYEEMYKINASENIKENILSGILKLYFKIRAHHKCRVYLNRHQMLTKASRKKKSLRKGLQGEE